MSTNRRKEKQKNKQKSSVCAILYFIKRKTNVFAVFILNQLNKYIELHPQNRNKCHMFIVPHFIASWNKENSLWWIKVSLHHFPSVHFFWTCSNNKPRHSSSSPHHSSLCIFEKYIHDFTQKRIETNVSLCIEVYGRIELKELL